LAACCAAKKAPNAVMAIAFWTAAGSTLDSGPVNHDIGLRDLAFHVEEQLCHCVRLRGVNAEDGGSSLFRERLELSGIASGEADLQADLTQAPRERSADARSGSDD
jgi:hypothetical protein